MNEMKLPQKLIYLRKHKGLTQLKVAEILGVSRQAISRWESGVAMPSTENFQGLSRLYGVSVDVLLNDDLVVPVNEDGHKPDAVTDKRLQDNDKYKRVVLACMLILMAIILLVTVIIKHDGSKGNDNGDIFVPMDELKSDKGDNFPSESFSVGW